MSDVRWAIYQESVERFCVVLHSYQNKRQVTFELGAYTASMGIVRIDESMHRTKEVCSFDNVQQMTEAIEWLEG